MISQTIQFMGQEPEALYNAYLSSKEHSAMTMNQLPAIYRRQGVGDVDQGKEGDELYAVGFPGPDGMPHFSVTAKLLKLVPGKVIVSAWKNFVWNFAVDPAQVTDLESTVVLTFKKNIAGAEIQLVQVNVPEYEVFIPDSGEKGPLDSLVNTHWSLVYWEPMRKYFKI